ncbi:DUF6270 domain-containing protein [Janibacter sp. UYMM211]|uniref:DUF6270 domain-containing protein n=1 Tax=Janibacter sp. UYMM211 TaxID=3156342 RepID=UPI00339186DE
MSDPTSSELVRTFIYGSCVSRDTLDTMHSTHEVLRYVARQSAISVGRPAVGVAERLDPIESAFQRRMVLGDLEGNFLSELSDHAASVDQLVIDLVDERSGVVRVGEGVVTRLHELWSAGGARATGGGQHLRLGTDAHFAMWSSSIGSIAAEIGRLGLTDRTVVLVTPWATHDDTGARLEIPAWMMPPDEANHQYRRYHERLSRLFETVELPADLAVSSLHHRWGTSPFHYTDAAYAFLAERIRISSKSSR